MNRTQAEQRHRVKREDESFMDWLDRKVQADPVAKAAYDDECRIIAEERAKRDREWQ